MGFIYLTNQAATSLGLTHAGVTVVLEPKGKPGSVRRVDAEWLQDEAISRYIGQGLLTGEETSPNIPDVQDLVVNLDRHNRNGFERIVFGDNDALAAELIGMTPQDNFPGAAPVIKEDAIKNHRHLLEVCAEALERLSKGSQKDMASRARKRLKLIKEKEQAGYSL